MAFSRHIYVIPGFLQDLGTRTRLIDLWQSLHGQLCGVHCSVQLRPWNSDWNAEAEFISRLSDDRPRVVTIGYSWGAGWGVVQLAKQLAKRGLGIKRACLIDPVYRHQYALGNWRAFIPWVPITIPRNVQRVTWWRQRQSWPMGHNLRAKHTGRTIIEPPGLIQADHAHMDDQESVIKQCREIAMEVAA